MHIGFVRFHRFFEVVDKRKEEKLARHRKAQNFSCPSCSFHAIFRLNLSDLLVVAGLYCLIKACPIRTVLAFILVRRC